MDHQSVTHSISSGSGNSATQGARTHVRISVISIVDSRVLIRCHTRVGHRACAQGSRQGVSPPGWIRLIATVTYKRQQLAHNGPFEEDSQTVQSAEWGHVWTRCCLLLVVNCMPHSMLLFFATHCYLNSTNIATMGYATQCKVNVILSLGRRRVVRKPRPKCSASSKCSRVSTPQNEL